MKTLSWLGRISLVPVVGAGLLVWWVAASLGRGAYDMSAWAAVLLFGGLALSRATPRVAVIALYGAFALQFARVVCRFDTIGWLAYASIPLAAIVFGAATVTHRRRLLSVLQHNESQSHRLIFVARCREGQTCQAANDQQLLAFFVEHRRIVSIKKRIIWTDFS